jgi:hypothetical protein
LLALAEHRPDTLWGILGWLNRLPSEWHIPLENTYRRARLERCGSITS